MTTSVQAAREWCRRLMKDAAHIQPVVIGAYVAPEADRALDAYRTALLDEAKRRVEEMKYDRTVEGHNGFEASVWDGAMNTVLATLTSMTTEQTDG